MNKGKCWMDEFGEIGWQTHIICNSQRIDLTEPRTTKTHDSKYINWWEYHSWNGAMAFRYPRIFPLGIMICSRLVFLEKYKDKPLFVLMWNTWNIPAHYWAGRKKNKIPFLSKIVIPGRCQNNLDLGFRSSSTIMIR